MYEKSKTNLDNVLQKIKTNNLPFILLLIILIIIMLVTIITDYFSFSKSKSRFEGFDVANDNRIPENIDTSQNEIYENESDKQIPVGDKKLLDDYRDNNPEDYDKYKKQYDKYNKEYDKNDSDKINNVSNDVKDYDNKNKNNYETTIKNEFLTAINNESNSAKNKPPNFNINIPTIKDPKVSNSIITISFFLIIFILCFVFLPNFRDFRNLFSQINNVTYVILYTVFLIIFLRLFPASIMKNNAYYIIPITIIVAVILFVTTLTSNYATVFNINYERIKMIILYLCFITISITYYSIDPGGYISKNFNVSLLLSILIGIFGFLYLVVLLTLPNVYHDAFRNSTNVTNASENISGFTKYGTISFVLFLIIITIVISTYPGGFFKNTTSSIIIIIILLIICIIWSILLVVNTFNGFNNNNPSNFIDSSLTVAKKTLLSLLGFSISGIIIAYIVYSVRQLSGRNNIISFVLSIFLIISMLILIYKTIFIKLPSNNVNKSKQAFFALILNLIFYIPCLFSGIFDVIMKTLVNEYNSTTTGNVLILIITLGLLLLYIFLPKIQHFTNSQGGNQLIQQPVYANTFQSLATHEKLNGSNNFDYQYGISFWIFIDSNAPNTNPSYNQYTSLLNYGGKPNVLYKPNTNTLLITMDQKELKQKSSTKLLEFDDNGNRIIYTNKNLLLQKWNNIIINFNGGTLDIFLNGELVKSSIEVIPYMKFDTLTIGSDGGINGGICNVVYFKNPLTITNIYYLYNNVKNNTPPVINTQFNVIN